MRLRHFYVFQADDALGEALVYVTGEVSYEIPFGEKKVCYSPKIFSGESHLITARKAREWEYESYRNLAVNVMDQHGDTNCYPHATANVETRGESVFAARNAIDGVTSNHSHATGHMVLGESTEIHRQQCVLTLEEK